MVPGKCTQCLKRAHLSAPRMQGPGYTQVCTRLIAGSSGGGDMFILYEMLGRGNELQGGVIPVLPPSKLIIVCTGVLAYRVSTLDILLRL